MLLWLSISMTLLLGTRRCYSVSSRGAKDDMLLQVRPKISLEPTLHSPFLSSSLPIDSSASENI
jgi:hypothetical protein